MLSVIITILLFIVHIMNHDIGIRLDSNSNWMINATIKVSY